VTVAGSVMDNLHSETSVGIIYSIQCCFTLLRRVQFEDLVEPATNTM